MHSILVSEMPQNALKEAEQLSMSNKCELLLHSSVQYLMGWIQDQIDQSSVVIQL